MVHHVVHEHLCAPGCYVPSVTDDMVDTQEAQERLMIWNAEAEHQRHLEWENESLVNVIEERQLRLRQHELHTMQHEWYEHRHRLSRRDLCVQEEAAFEGIREVHRKRTRALVAEEDEYRKRLRYVDGQMIDCQLLIIIHVIEPAGRVQLDLEEQWGRIRLEAMIVN